MFTYRVESKATGELVFIYNAESPIEWTQYPFSNYNHIETPYVDPNTPPAPNPAPPTSITKLAFLRLFTQDERIAMRAAAAQSPQVEDYMQLLSLAEEVFLTDPDTIAGVNMMEQAGLLAAGRAAEILNG